VAFRIKSEPIVTIVVLDEDHKYHWYPCYLLLVLFLQLDGGEINSCLEVSISTCKAWHINRFIYVLFPLVYDLCRHFGSSEGKESLAEVSAGSVVTLFNALEKSVIPPPFRVLTLLEELKESPCEWAQCVPFENVHGPACLVQV